MHFNVLARANRIDSCEPMQSITSLSYWLLSQITIVETMTVGKREINPVDLTIIYRWKAITRAWDSNLRSLPSRPCAILTKLPSPADRSKAVGSGPSIWPIMIKAFLGSFPHFLSREKENLQLEKVRKNPKKRSYCARERLISKLFMSQDPTSMASAKWSDRLKFLSNGPDIPGSCRLDLANTFQTIFEDTLPKISLRFRQKCRLFLTGLKMTLIIILRRALAKGGLMHRHATL